MMLCVYDFWCGCDDNVNVIQDNEGSNHVVENIENMFDWCLFNNDNHVLILLNGFALFESV